VKMQRAEIIELSLVGGTCLIIIGIQLWESSTVRAQAKGSREDGNRLLSEHFARVESAAGIKSRAQHLRPVPTRPIDVEDGSDGPRVAMETTAGTDTPESFVPPFDELPGFIPIVPDDGA
jgi:hypothetical protein